MNKYSFPNSNVRLAIILAESVVFADTFRRIALMYW